MGCISHFVSHDLSIFVTLSWDVLYYRYHYTYRLQYVSLKLVLLYLIQLTGILELIWVQHVHVLVL